MRRPLPLRCAGRMAALALALAVPAVAWCADGARLASDQGCLNCHAASGRAGAGPSLQQLSERAARHGDGEAGLKHLLQEIREHGSINSHRQVSDAAALDILRWLARGAKPAAGN